METVKPIHEWLGIPSESVAGDGAVWIGCVNTGNITYRDSSGKIVDTCFRENDSGGFERYDPNELSDTERISVVGTMHRHGHRDAEFIADFLKIDVAVIRQDMCHIGLDKRQEMVEFFGIKDYSCLWWDWNDASETGFITYKKRKFHFYFTARFRRTKSGQLEVYETISPLR